MTELAAPPAYPVRLEVDYPERQSRWKALFRLPLSIPVLIFSALMNVVLYGVIVLWLAVLVRGRTPRWLFDMIVAANRARARARAYVLLLTDEYPTFEGPSPISYEVAFPERTSRWRLVIWKLLTAVPHWVVLQVLQFAAFAVLPIAWVAVLVSGRYPRGLHTFVAGVLRWERRVEAYLFSLTDEFPPFSLSPDAGPAGRESYIISSVLGVLLAAASIGGIVALVVFASDQQTTVEVSYQDLLDGQITGFQTTVSAGSLAVALTGAEDPADASFPLLRARDGWRFVALEIRVQDFRDRGVTFDELDFSLKDRGGNRHDLFFATVNKRTLPESIEANEEGVVLLLFELEEDVDPAELRYRVRARLFAPIVYRFLP